MRANCPNEKHPDWINIVNTVGYINAYRLFVNNGYEIPEEGIFRNSTDILKYLSKSNLLQKSNEKYYIPYISTTSFSSRMDKVISMVDKINTMYGGPILVVDSHPVTDSRYGRDFAYFVDVNEKALKDFWQGTVEKDVHRGTMNIDGDIIPYDPDIYYQLEGATLDIEDYKDFKRKTEYLIKFFPGYIIVEDYKLPIPAKFDRKTNKIYINPKLITTDAIGHEFGHIIIDELGGVDNPLVKRAREQLIDSDIEKQVFKKYSNLIGVDDIKLDKEVLAQAMGLESVQLFKDEFNQTEWIRIFKRLLYVIKEKLGLNNDAVQELSRKLVDRNWNRIKETVQSRIDKEYAEAIKGKGVDDVTKLINQILDSLYKKRAIRGRFGADVKAAELSKLIKQIEQKNANPIVSLKRFQDFAKKETDTIYLDFLEAKRKESQGERGFSLKLLNRWKNYMAGFASINDLLQLLSDAAIETKDVSKAEKIGTTLNKNILLDIKEKHETIENAYLVEGKKLVAKFLAKYSNHIAVQDREDYETEWFKLSKEEKSKISRDDYIKEKETANMNKSQSRTEKYIELELERASRDIGTISRYLDNVLDSPDPVVASMVNAFAQNMRKARLDKYELKDKFVEILRELEEFQGKKHGFFKDEKEFYDFMLEQDIDSEGNLDYTGHIIGPFTSKFWLDYGKFMNQLRNKNLRSNIFRRKAEEWRDKFAPRTKEAEQQFERDRMKFINSLEKEGLLNSAEIKKIESFFKDVNGSTTLEELIDEDVAQTITDWVRDNSWNYRSPINKYRSSKWLELVEMSGGNPNLEIFEQIKSVDKNKYNDPRVKFFNFIRTNVNEQQSKVPYAHRLYSRLPGVVKKSGETLRSGEGIKKTISKAFQETFDVLADETERGGVMVQKELTTEEGKPILFVPVHYTNKLDPKNQSFNIADIYYKYFSSVIDYSYKHEILPEIEMTRQLLNSRDVIKRDSVGKIIIDKFRGKKLSQKGMTSQIAQQFSDWVEAVVYDRKILDRGGTFKIFNKTFDTAKFFDALNKYTALNLLGLNIVQGTANVALGSALQWIESFGGMKGRDHYSPKDYIKAKKFYTKNFKGVLKDIGSRKPTGILTLLNREFDTLNDYTGGNLRRDSRFAQLLDSDTLFFTSHAGEHMMQTKVMLAMLNRLEAKSETGETIGNMLDMFSIKDGKLDLDERVKNFDQDARTVFEGKLKRVLSAMHGEYSELGRVAIQRYALGRMGYMFRKFVVPGYKRRWGKYYVNNLSYEVSEGNYRITARFFKQLILDVGKYKFSVMSVDWANLKGRERAAIVKTMSELGFLIGVSILIGAMEHSDSDDDWWRNFLSYQFYRFRAELTFFSNPSSTMQILRSPAACMSIVENTFRMIGELIKGTYPDQLGLDVYERGNWKGRKKITKRLINFVPGWRQIYRLMFVDDQISWLKT